MLVSSSTDTRPSDTVGEVHHERRRSRSLEPPRTREKDADSDGGGSTPMPLKAAGVGTSDMGALMSAGGNQAMVQHFGAASGPDARRAGGDGAAVGRAPEATSAGEAGGGAAPEASPELPIVATINPSKELVGGLGVAPFGQMDPTFTFKNVTTNVADGAIQLTATLNCHYHWGVDDGGNTDVVTGQEPFITEDNYEGVADDLDPDKGDDAGVANYDTYWSKLATENHEKEHARDDWEEFILPAGVDLAKAKFAEHKATKETAAAKVNALITTGGSHSRHPGKIPHEVFKGSDKHYGIPGAYLSRPGEIKAHAVGALVERPLVARIRAHGAALKAAKAATTPARKAGSAAGAATGADRSKGKRKPSRDREDTHDEQPQGT